MVRILVRNGATEVNPVRVRRSRDAMLLGESEVSLLFSTGCFVYGDRGSEVGP